MTDFTSSLHFQPASLDFQAACVVGHANYQSYLVHAAVTSGRALRAGAHELLDELVPVLKSRVQSRICSNTMEDKAQNINIYSGDLIET